jgi:hypothetical protein
MNPNPNCYRVAGELPPVIMITYGAPKLVSVSVSVLDPPTPNSLLHTQLELEAEVGIEPTIQLLQSRALPLGDPAFVSPKAYNASASTQVPFFTLLPRFIVRIPADVGLPKVPPA